METIYDEERLLSLKGKARTLKYGVELFLKYPERFHHKTFLEEVEWDIKGNLHVGNVFDDNIDLFIELFNKKQTKEDDKINDKILIVNKGNGHFELIKKLSKLTSIYSLDLTMSVATLSTKLAAEPTGLK